MMREYEAAGPTLELRGTVVAPHVWPQKPWPYYFLACYGH